jgi:hypothetical protein
MRDYDPGLIPKLRLPRGFPDFCRDCSHFALEVKAGEDFIKGTFCARLPDWPKSCHKNAEELVPCGAYRKRDRRPGIYYLRECAPEVLDLEHYF